jgi:hypothetical protein
LPEGALSTPRQSSRRRKLREIPHKFDCPVIGVCFGVEELRDMKSSGASGLSRLIDQNRTEAALPATNI